jgi:hypothetical protein
MGHMRHLQVSNLPGQLVQVPALCVQKRDVPQVALHRADVLQRTAHTMSLGLRAGNRSKQCCFAPHSACARLSSISMACCTSSLG